MWSTRAAQRKTALRISKCPLGREERGGAPGRGTISTVLWAQKEAAFIDLQSPGEGEGCVTTELKAGQPGPSTSFPSILSLCAVMTAGPVGTGPAQQPSQSDLMLPNFTLFRLWFSSFR